MTKPCKLRILALGVLAAALAGPTPLVRAQAATSPFVIGVNAASRELPMIGTTGMTMVRMDHPDPAVIESARRYGLEVLPIADYGYPDLSESDSWMLPPLPQHRGEWARRMVDTWRKMTNPPKVFEVWNEPWQSSFWGPKPDPAAYLALVQAFAREAWAVWPNATVLVSADDGLSDYPTFRRDLLAADTTGFLNDRRILPTTHNYVGNRDPGQVTAKPCVWDLNRYECAYDDFKRHGHPNPQVWITEFGWESDDDNPGYSLYGAVSERAQAYNTVQALLMFHASGKVAAAFSYMYLSDSRWNYNWVTPDNREKLILPSVRRLAFFLRRKAGLASDD